jgi:hypothetical protein
MPSVLNRPATMKTFKPTGAAAVLAADVLIDWPALVGNDSKLPMMRKHRRAGCWTGSHRTGEDRSRPERPRGRSLRRGSAPTIPVPVRCEEIVRC